MASSNKHWPSMFKSKPSTTTHLHQWQHDLSSCHRNPYSPGPGCEERTPEPKPRWNPRPEQIRILESIFNSGMVNPPRDEIRKIRAQLQEYGQVGDANVFYWFQNRKSRSKHKQRQMLHHNKPQNTPPPPPPPIATTISSAAAVTPPSSSSSSSDKSSPNNHLSSSNVIDLLNSPTGSVNQPYFQNSAEFLSEPYFFPVLQGNNHGGAGGFCFPENVTVGNNCPSVLLGELMLMSNVPAKKDDVDDGKMKMQQEIGYGGGGGAPNSGEHLLPPSLSINHLLQGAGSGESGPPKSTVFINDVCFEVASGPFNVRDAFGDDAMLIQSSGHPVITNEWGVTLQPLQQGAFYYLVRAFSPSPNERTIDLI